MLLEDQDLVRPERDPDGPADEPGRDGVLVLADRDPGGLVDPRRQRQPDVELLLRDRSQQRGLVGEVEPDRGGPVVDVPGVLLRLDPLDPLVQVRQRVDLGNRDQMRSAEAPALVLDTALLVGALLAGPAVERVEADLP
ncbi:hypothetical protein AB0D10_42025 [Kitasatospora sp. NPDC048545]|uniref:hypothetical protein n=1 Tax=Kitasatospora sp. NPDC048545 TaxID=3157208 RepID=UPI0033D74AED